MQYKKVEAISTPIRDLSFPSKQTNNQFLIVEQVFYYTKHICGNKSANKCMS